MDEKRQLTVCGSFGFGNAGDEAVPLAYHDLARACGISLDLAVLGRFDRPAMPEVIGIGRADRGRREKLRGRRLLMSGGGVIEPALGGVIWRCADFLPPFSSSAGLFAVNVEANVHYGWLQRFRLRRLLSRLSLVTVRDELSARVLRSLAPRVPVEVVGDSVLWMEPAAELPPEIRHLGRFIAVCLAPRWANDPAWYAWIGRELADLANALDAAILFVPFSVMADDDRPEHDRVRHAVTAADPRLATRIAMVERELPPRQLAKVLGKAELAISMRLHGCVMAYAARTPFVALAYHPKLTGFTETVGWERFVLPRRFPVAQSAGHYGFSFADLDWSDASLVAAGREAVAFADFSRLEPLRERLRAAFSRFMEGGR
jgi:polysaccharide pyruvyl transferase WcaK-like protein